MKDLIQKMISYSVYSENQYKIHRSYQKEAFEGNFTLTVEDQDEVTEAMEVVTWLHNFSDILSSIPTRILGAINID